MVLPSPLAILGTLALVLGAVAPPGLGAQTDTGVAGVYADSLAGHKTASGEPYDPAALTAAHPSLRFGIRLLVTNPANGRSVVVTVNDRGPAVEGRLLDLSRAAALALGLDPRGVAPVEARVLRAGEAGGFTPTPDPPVWFQMGAFRTETNARGLVSQLRAQGYEPVVRKEKDLWRVYLAAPPGQGAGWSARLTAQGWKGFLQLAREPSGDPVSLDRPLSTD